MSRNPEATRAKLLAAGRAEFAAHGLAGARVDRIARNAGVNKERLYANFGNKEGLYNTVLELALQQLRTATPLSPQQDEGIGAFVRRVFEFHRADPTVMRIFMWEALSTGAADLVADRERREFYAGRVTEIQDQLKVGDRAAAARLLFVLIGLAAWRTVMPNLAHLFTDGDADTDEGLNALREFIVEFAEHGYRAARPSDGAADS